MRVCTRVYVSTPIKTLMKKKTIIPIKVTVSSLCQIKSGYTTELIANTKVSHSNHDDKSLRKVA